MYEATQKQVKRKARSAESPTWLKFVEEDKRRRHRGVSSLRYSEVSLQSNEDFRIFWSSVEF